MAEDDERKKAPPKALQFLERGRLAAIVDAVYAFAMTLLIFSIKMPDGSAGAAGGTLLSQWPILFDYALSFMILGFFWVAHNWQFRHIGRVDEKYVWLNLICLLFVVFLPFSTELIGSYSESTTAEIFFHLNMLGVLLFLYLQSLYVNRHQALVDADRFEPESFRIGMDITKRFMLVALLGIAISFWVPGWSNIVYLLVPLFSFVQKRRKRKPVEKKSK